MDKLDMDMDMDNPGEELVVQTLKQKPSAKGVAIVVANQRSRKFPADILNGVVHDFTKTCLVFEDLQYAVIRLGNARKKDIIDVVNAVAKRFPTRFERIDPRYKRIVFCFAGHGDGNDCIHTRDGEIDVTKEIMWPLLPIEKPGLRHVPKLFFIDACRGKAEDEPIPRGGGDYFVHSRVSALSNYLLLRSTLPAMKAFENPGHKLQGGFWTQAFVAELEKDTNRGKDIGYILIEVNRHVNKMFNEPGFSCIQQAIAENTLLDHVFFLDEAEELKVFCIEATQRYLQYETSPHGYDSSPRVISSHPLIDRGQTLSAPTTIGSSEVEPPLATASLAPIDPFAQLEALLKERCGRDVKIEYKYKEVRGGYQATVLAPVIGYMDGEVCSSKARAQESAATVAFNSLQ